MSTIWRNLKPSDPQETDDPLFHGAIPRYIVYYFILVHSILIHLLEDVKTRWNAFMSVGQSFEMKTFPIPKPASPRLPRERAVEREKKR